MEDIIVHIPTLTLIYLLEQLLDLEPTLLSDPRLIWRKMILDELEKRVKNSVYTASPAEE